MLQFRAKRRDGTSYPSRGNTRGGSARRLRIEGMERRLMLSATMPEASPSQLSTISLSEVEMSVIAAPWMLVNPMPSEGGWIVLDSADASQVTNGAGYTVGQGYGVYADQIGDAHGLTGVSSRELLDRISPQPIDTAPRGAWIYGSLLQSLDFNGLDTSQSAFGIGTDDVSLTNISVRVNGWQPVTMVLNYSWGAIEPTVTAASENAKEGATSHSEGGSIAINSVLAELKQQPPVAATEKPAETHAVETTIDAHHSAQGTAPTAILIPGEWGRASIFEIVGADEHVALSLERSKSQRDQRRADIELPLFSSGEDIAEPHASVPRTGDDLSHQNDGPTSPDRSPGTTPVNDASGTNGPGLISGGAVTIENRSGGVSSPSAKSAELPSGRTVATKPHRASLGAIAAVLDEFGIGEKTSELWQGSRVAAAVVLVLALERVAAFHWREANRKSSEAKTTPLAPTKPIRRKMGAGLQLDAR